MTYTTSSDWWQIGLMLASAAVFYLLITGKRQ